MPFIRVRDSLGGLLATLFPPRTFFVAQASPSWFKGVAHLTANKGRTYSPHAFRPFFVLVAPPVGLKGFVCRNTNYDTSRALFRPAAPTVVGTYRGLEAQAGSVIRPRGLCSTISTLCMLVGPYYSLGCLIRRIL